MTDVQWVSIGDRPPGTSPAGSETSAQGAAFARKQTEALMLTQCPHRQKINRSGEWLRSLVERIARLLTGETFALIPQRQVDRLRQLERREELLMAERRGDTEFLDRELARAQLTPEDLSRSSGQTTPISQWPDEDFEGCAGECAESQEQQGTGI